MRNGVASNDADGLMRGANGPRAGVYVAYYRAANHPMKLRIERWMRGLLGVTHVVADSPSGVRYTLVPDDFVQREILRFGAYEPRTLALMQRLLQPGDTMVDVGGHVGQFALHAAQCVGKRGRVVVLEPNPLTYRYLLHNIALNGFDQIVPVLGAAGAQSGVARMILPAAGNWGGSRASRGNSDQAGFYTLTAPLATLLPQLGVTRVDFLKIDVEGLEPQVLASIDQAPVLRPRHIVLEFIPTLIEEQGGSASALLDMLRDSGYSLRQIDGAAYVPGADLHEFNLWASDQRG